jgi:GNAT superfamily N-acetyltransferase
MSDVETPTVDDDFIRRRSVALTARNGRRVLLRPIVPGDKPRLVEGFERLSPVSRYRRFLAAVTRLRPEQLVQLTELDYVNHFAIGALALDEPGEPGVGVARYVRYTDDPESAEAAVAVLDDFQGYGIGTLLMRALGAVALENGVRYFRAEVLADNRPVREMLARLGARLERGGNPTTFVIDLRRQQAALADDALRDTLRALARGEVGVSGP